jgi:hypothetical protein
MRRVGLTLVTIATAGVSLFFLYYTIRLAYVCTRGARTHRAPAGMYIGAVAFPCICVVAGILAAKSVRALATR